MSKVDALIMRHQR